MCVPALMLVSSSRGNTVGALLWASSFIRDTETGWGRGLGGAHCSSSSSQIDDTRTFLPEALVGDGGRQGLLSKLISNMVSV